LLISSSDDETFFCSKQVVHQTKDVIQAKGVTAEIKRIVHFLFVYLNFFTL